MPHKPRFGRIYHPKKKLPDGKRIEINTWWIQYSHNGVQVRESSKSSRYTDAEMLLRKRLTEIESGSYAGTTVQRVTVAKLLDALIADFETNEKSTVWLRSIDRRLRPFFGPLRAQSVSTDHLQAYVAQRRKAGVKNSTINRELARLKRAFNLAREATPPKVKNIPRFPRLTEPPPRRGFFEYDQFVRIRRELPEHLRPPVTFAFFTGCRKGEIMGLERDQVDLLSRVVRLHHDQTKGEESRTLPLTGELFEVVKMQLEYTERYFPQCPLLFHREGENTYDFRKAWETACRRAGLWEGNEDTGKPTRLFHDLRRTGVRNLVRAGVPERVAMMISGHRTRAVFDRYNIVSERDLHEAAAKLDTYLSELEEQHERATFGATRRNSEPRAIS